LAGADIDDVFGVVRGSNAVHERSQALDLVLLRGAAAQRRSSHLIDPIQ
jgi:hypothetical protein